MELIKAFLAGKISLNEFLEKLYVDTDLQELLEEEQNMKPFTNDGSLLLFFLNTSIHASGFEINARYALKEFLEKKNINFEFDTLSIEFGDIVRSLLPKWLQVDVKYFEEIGATFDGNNKKDVKLMIKEKVSSDFKFIKSAPKWIQDQFWPLSEGKPMVFIGELDMGTLMHDTSRVFVFYDQSSNTFKNIVQSY